VAAVTRKLGKTEAREGPLLSSSEPNRETPPDCPAWKAQPRLGQARRKAPARFDDARGYTEWPSNNRKGGSRFYTIRFGRTQYTPKLKKRTALLGKLRDIFRRYASQPVGRVIKLISPILRGWVNYFAVGHSSRCYSFVRTGKEFGDT
jgi:hypothetical protein